MNHMIVSLTDDETVVVANACDDCDSCDSCDQGGEGGGACDYCDGPMG